MVFFSHIISCHSHIEMSVNILRLRAELSFRQGVFQSGVSGTHTISCIAQVKDRIAHGFRSACQNNIRIAGLDRSHSIEGSHHSGSAGAHNRRRRRFLRDPGTKSSDSCNVGRIRTLPALSHIHLIDLFRINAASIYDPSHDIYCQILCGKGF